LYRTQSLKGTIIMIRRPGQLATLAVLGVGLLFPLGVHAAAKKPKLSVRPACVVVGHGSLDVRLTGLNKGEGVSFIAQPHFQGFGGGVMGMHRAGPRGVIEFRYSGAKKKWEVGKWTVSAYRQGGKLLATTQYRVAKSAC
jgi:hypothetical protein